ncbi:MAG: hypothetical protein WA631_04145 [Nitrososphaeraceae archaeon]
MSLSTTSNLTPFQTVLRSVHSFVGLSDSETSLPRRSDMKAKGFCLYNEDDFNWRLSRIQKKRLLIHHSRELLITTTPTVK